MAEFTTITGLKRPYEYSLTDKQLEKLTPFGQTMWTIMTDKNTEIAYSLKTSQSMIEKASFFYGWPWYAKIDNATYDDAFTAFYNKQNTASRMTAETYFKGLSRYYTENDWNKQFPLGWNQ